jgi:hypothetical protein
MLNVARQNDLKGLKCLRIRDQMLTKCFISAKQAAFSTKGNKMHPPDPNQVLNFLQKQP